MAKTRTKDVDKTVQTFTQGMLGNPVYTAIVQRLVQQQAKGHEKYGTLINIDDYSLIEWIEHTQQELTDQLVYFECVKQTLQRRSDGMKQSSV